MSALKILAAQLQSMELAAYLDTREAMLMKQKEEVAEGMHNLAKIMELRSK